MLDFTGAPKKQCFRLSVKKHSKPTPDIKCSHSYFRQQVHSILERFKCSEKCLKIQEQHFRPTQFSQKRPESKNSSTEKYFSATKYLFVSLNCRVPKFGVNRLQHSWVFCLPHVFKGTLCQFRKIAKGGAAAMASRLGSAVWLGSIKHHCRSKQVQQVRGARRGTAWGRCSTA